MYDGIDIRVTGDPRDVGKDRFVLEAKGRKPTNSFVLSKPAISATHWMDREDYEDEDTPEEVKVGYKITMKSYRDAPEEQKKRKYDLIVPDRDDGRAPALTDTPFVPNNKKTDTLVIHAAHQVALYDTGNTVPDDYEEDQEIVLENIATTLSWRLIDLNSERPIDDDEGERGQSEIQKKLAAKRRRHRAAAAAGSTKPGK